MDNFSSRPFFFRFGNRGDPFEGGSNFRHRMDDDDDHFTFGFSDDFVKQTMEILDQVKRHFEEFDQSVFPPEVNIVEKDEDNKEDEPWKQMLKQDDGFFKHGGIYEADPNEAIRDSIVSSSNLPVSKSPPSPPGDHTKSFFFSSKSSFKSFNGQKFEEKKEVRDNDGNLQTTVRRVIGDQAYSVTTKKGSDGKEEKIEKFENVSPEELESFNKKWSEPGPSLTLLPPGDNDFDLPPLPPSGLYSRDHQDSIIPLKEHPTPKHEPLFSWVMKKIFGD